MIVKVRWSGGGSFAAGQLVIVEEKLPFSLRTKTQAGLDYAAGK